MGGPYLAKARSTISIARTTPAQKPRGCARMTFKPLSVGLVVLELCKSLPPETYADSNGNWAARMPRARAEVESGGNGPCEVIKTARLSVPENLRLRGCRPGCTYSPKRRIVMITVFSPFLMFTAASL